MKIEFIICTPEMRLAGLINEHKDTTVLVNSSENRRRSPLIRAANVLPEPAEVVTEREKKDLATLNLQGSMYSRLNTY